MKKKTEKVLCTSIKEYKEKYSQRDFGDLVRSQDIDASLVGAKMAQISLDNVKSIIRK